MEKIRIQDDLYEAVNGEWLENAVIPEDRPTAGGFSELDLDVEKTMMADFRAFAKGEKHSDIKEMEEAIKLYRQVLDVEKRNELGLKPVKGLLNKILKLKDADELNKQLKNFFFEGVSLPFQFFIQADMKDATKHCLMLAGPDIILPDTTYYQNEQVAAQLFGLYSQMATMALAHTSLSKAKQAKVLADTIAFDKLIAKTVKSQVEWSEYVKIYNPTPLNEVVNDLSPVDVNGLLRSVLGNNTPEVIVVADPRAIKEFNTYFTPENFELFKSWCYLKTLLSKAPYLSVELASISGIYRRALMGVAQEPELEKQAYHMASSVFSEPIGVYYGRTYFGEEAKKDIVNLVKQIIATYKKRMRKNTFLEEPTKAKAIKKLSTIKVKMGYPDKIDKFYSKLVVKEEDSYYETMNKLMKLSLKHEIAKLPKKVDRSRWLMPGHMVNACYDPSRNDITFPAAILQKPFYSINQTVSENLGGIGAVIGHEISHAFDNNGSHMDENGNLFDWWTEKDFAEFDKLTKEMIEQWDGIEFHGGKVNGTLVVSENIADNGGMAVTIDIMHRIKGNFEEYFMNWARVWCLKAKEEYIQLLLVNDVHSPNKLRANMNPRNFKEWYKAFGVKAKDKMYIAPNKRIVIW